MCGILFTTQPAIGADAFAAALDVMRHRGPDAAGCMVTNGTARIGHNRISVVDLNPRSNQPF